ncbi:hypothetical protein CC78DRAFT_169318 [Lojkania enalia]|uniref:Uncharacterized protein n=1 Tax=Lojkania enalia TaxID=147567 RepID=A0A9P4KE06_9PLEO|nr:hypothetical protein CC78DRAFT_169318 [Didymosphaeria enalia]
MASPGTLTCCFPFLSFDVVSRTTQRVPHMSQPHKNALGSAHHVPPVTAHLLSSRSPLHVLDLRTFPGVQALQSLNAFYYFCWTPRSPLNPASPDHDTIVRYFHVEIVCPYFHFSGDSDLPSLSNPAKYPNLAHT